MGRRIWWEFTHQDRLGLFFTWGAIVCAYIILTGVLVLTLAS
jgi:hypothetical protein